MVNIESIVYDKKISYKKKNVMTKYAKYCKEDNCKKYAYYNFPDEKKKLFCKQHKKDNMVNKITKKLKKIINVNI